ncbi:nitroreductase [Bacillus luteolus]|uniref:Nitroreductase n=1 Tax=Litchfieldia luteola TaxID=682179 RepID=A0ABR9QGD3_9BACI|nr:nitroreductase family protein [Cytobacillus luteolus]MBE4907550.1 nitroreductase [Cytobacillus luteolus]MBP1944321.1 nitroreductase [Cytobacillus luteolus]
MNDNRSMIEVMRNRKSIRTYKTENISDGDYQAIIEYIQKAGSFSGPFNRQGKVALVQVNNNVTDKGIKLGTYGFIKNPRAYLVGITEKNKYSLVDFAYSFHKLTLFATGIGLGTCWMGGTFSRNSFEQELSSIKDGEFIPCITPIGYPNEKERIFDKAVRVVVKADNKKAWEKLFFDAAFDKPLREENAGPLAIPIEMLRLGPSASNKQPWRLVVSPDRKTSHLYIEHTPNYSSSLGYDMQLLDMGIAMCQFDMACKELSLEGKWIVEDPEMDLPNSNYEYIASWQINS